MKVLPHLYTESRALARLGSDFTSTSSTEAQWEGRCGGPSTGEQAGLGLPWGSLKLRLQCQQEKPTVVESTKG